MDPTMIVAVNELSSQQFTPTQNTINKFNMLMDYAHTYPDAIIRYHASDMYLHIDYDATYLVQPCARSRVAGHFYLINNISEVTCIPKSTPTGPILTEFHTVRNAISLAAEAETIGMFHNAKMAVPIRAALTELVHTQPLATIRTDNSTSHGILTSTIRKKCYKSFDMNIHWIKDWIKRKNTFYFGIKNK